MKAPAVPAGGYRLHRAWLVAGVTFVAMLTAAGFRATPGVLMVPLQEEFGWSRAAISFAVSVNLTLFGLTAPFAAALMERIGVRRVVTGALLTIAVGAGLTVIMRSTWQLVLFWGVMVGVGAGSMAVVLAATVTGRWFVKHRGLVTGVLTASSATGQLVFLPLLAFLVDRYGWRTASLAVTAAAFAVAPLVLLLMRDRPADVGLRPYGEEEAGGDPEAAAPVTSGGAGSPKPAAATGALAALRDGSRSLDFWLLAGSFAICGATTVGLVGTHFIPAAHDHAMPATTAAGLLALIGIFDIVGTTASGWLTDRVSSVRLLVWYYGLRGLSLLLLPSLIGPEIQATLFLFVLFYGLDWVATVPPTIALCRQRFGQARAGVMFGWVFGAHQIGAAAAAAAAGTIRTNLGDYRLAWFGAGVLCWLAVGLVLGLARRPRSARPTATGTFAPEPGAS